MYAQEKLFPGTNGKTQPTVKCHGCNKHGHYISHCPEENGQQNLNIGKMRGEKDDEVEEIKGAHNLQIRELLDNGDSPSSNESYIVDFSDFQFLQNRKVASKLSTE